MNKKSTILLFVIAFLFSGFVFYKQNERGIEGLIPKEAPVGYTVEPTEADVATVTVLDLEQQPVEVDISDWPYYKNEKLNFQFRHPPEYEVVRHERSDESLIDNEMLLNLLLSKNDKEVKGLEWILGFDVYDEFHGITNRRIEQIEENNDDRFYSERYAFSEDHDIWYYALHTTEEDIWNYYSWFDHADYQIESRLTHESLKYDSDKLVLRADQQEPMVEYQAVLATFQEIE